MTQQPQQAHEQNQGEGTPPPWPFPTQDHHPTPAPEAPKPEVEQPSEGALDHAIEESFPASDPPATAVSEVPTPPAQGQDRPADQRGG